VALSPATADELADAALDKAEFCIVTGVQPSEYDELTDTERAAFVEVVNKRASKG
jgi:hypothetical protein